MSVRELIELKRECEAIEIPSGTRRVLPAGSLLRISQFLGNAYTVICDIGYMYRIDANDADALGVAPIGAAQEEATTEATFSEPMVWDQLRTIYDPEIPVKHTSHLGSPAAKQKNWQSFVR